MPDRVLELETAAHRKRAAILSLAIGGMMLVMKTGAFLVTGSAAILSDAIESVVHVAATAMAFYSVVVSARPADKSHPYGHGKVEFFSAGFEGAMILLAAIAIIVEVLRGVLFGRELSQLDLGILATVAAGAVNLFLGFHLVAMGRKYRSLTLVADGKHVLTDSYTSIGVVGGLVLVKLTGWSFFDPAVAIAVALNIMFTGVHLMRVSVRGLMDETDPQVLQRVVETIERARKPAWIDVHRLRVFKSGELHHVDCHMTVPWYWEIRTGHNTEREVADILSQAFDEQAEVIVHLDPCAPQCCRFCQIEDCRVRTGTFEARQSLTVEHVVQPAGYLPSSEND